MPNFEEFVLQGWRAEIGAHITFAQHANTLQVRTKVYTGPSGVSLGWLPDTGSDIDAIGLLHLTSLGEHSENLARNLDHATAANGTTLVSLGQISTTLSLGTAQHTTMLHICDNLDEPLLSCNSL